MSTQHQPQDNFILILVALAAILTFLFIGMTVKPPVQVPQGDAYSITGGGR